MRKYTIEELSLKDKELACWDLTTIPELIECHCYF